MEIFKNEFLKIYHFIQHVLKILLDNPVWKAAILNVVGLPMPATASLDSVVMVVMTAIKETDVKLVSKTKFPINWTRDHKAPAVSRIIYSLITQVGFCF